MRVSSTTPGDALNTTSSCSTSLCEDFCSTSLCETTPTHGSTSTHGDSHGNTPRLGAACLAHSYSYGNTPRLSAAGRVYVRPGTSSSISSTHVMCVRVTLRLGLRGPTRGVGRAAVRASGLRLRCALTECAQRSGSRSGRVLRHCFTLPREGAHAGATQRLHVAVLAPTQCLYITHFGS